MLSSLWKALRSYIPAIALSVVICLISLILQIPYKDEEENDPDWFETISRSPYARLCLPPNCFSRVSGQLSTMSTKPSVQGVGLSGMLNGGNADQNGCDTYTYNGCVVQATTISGSSTSHASAQIYSHLTHVLGQVLPLSGLKLHPENVLPESQPLLCFVNSRSGGYQGQLVIRQLRKLLNPHQVCDLAVIDPYTTLQEFSVIPSLRILVCGGDGTVGWILNCIEKLPRERRPPVAILPLGTGNDLARVLGWGTTSDVSLSELMQQIQHASITMLDRWDLKVYSLSGGNKASKTITFNNYFGVGVDAQIVLKFHLLREKAPERFFSQFTNKVWYGIMGLQELWRSNCKGMFDQVQLFADGREINLPDDIQGFVFLNIGSYGGGVKLWSNERGQRSSSSGSSSNSTSPDQSSDDESECDRHQMMNSYNQSSVSNMTVKFPHWQNMSIQDKLLECVAITSPLQLARVKFGFEHCQKLAQATEFEIRSKRSLPLQADGEPWGEAPCIILIKPAVQALMLKQTSDVADSEVTDVLEWAERNNVISANQKMVMLHEFSKRREIRGDRSLGENFLHPSTAASTFNCQLESKEHISYDS